MRIRFLLTVLPVAICWFSSYAQSVADYQKIRTVVPPSPNASSLGAYAEYPTEGYSGIPSINIPLYEVKLNGFTLPVSLSYNASGIKVREVASWVGLGWSLNAGGVITRSVNKWPDDIWRLRNRGKNRGYLIGGSEQAESFTTAGKSEMQIASQLSKRAGSYYTFDDNLNPVHDCVEGFHKNMYDTEPDYFYYNFAGKVGKFLMGTDKNMKFVPYRNFQSSYMLDVISTYPDNSLNSLGIREFKIVDEEGNQYIFGTEDTASYRITGGSLPSNCVVGWPPYTDPMEVYRFFSSWYLSQIITAFGEKIQFTYEKERVVTVNRVLIGRDYHDKDYDMVNDSETSTWANRLVRIESKYEKLEFIADMNRDDLFNSKALTAIEVYAKVDGTWAFRKKIEFNQSYFYSPATPPTAWGVMTHDNGGNTHKRLRLNSIREVSGGIARAPHEFSYMEDFPFPNRHSYQQDFWGYFAENTGEYPFPGLYVYPNSDGSTRISVFKLYNMSTPEYQLDGEMRSANTFTSLGLSLKKIKYPTGGSTSFELESNDFFFNTINRTGGGLRLKKMTIKNCDDCPDDVTKIYTYRKSSDPTKSSGLLLSLPFFAATENSCGYYSRRYKGDVWPAMFSRLSEDYFRYFTVKMDQAKSTLGMDVGVNVGYTEIKEEIVGNGYNIRTFSVPAVAMQFDDKPTSGQCDPLTDGYCDGLFETPEVKYVQGYSLTDYGGSSGCDGGLAYTSPTAYPTNADVVGMNFGRWGYPFFPSMNYDWNRGLLLGKKTYDVNNKLLAEEAYKYRLYYPTGGIAYMPVVSYVNGNNYNITYNPGSPRDWDFWLYSKFRYMANVVKLPSQRILKSYDQADPAKFVETKTDIFYDNAVYPFQTSSETTNSKGEKILRLKKYAFDKTAIHAISPLPVNAQSAMDNMVNRNEVASPVYEETRVNGVFNNSSLVHYKIWDGAQRVNLPEEIFSKIGSNSQQLQAKFSGYDMYGNLLSESKANDLPVSYLWGYNNLYPIAKIVNASPAEAWYDSFEGPAGTADGAAKTGNKSYTGDLAIAFALPATNRPYRLTYWYWNGTAWIFAEKNYTGPLTITDGTKIDEVRIYPQNAFMTTYTYDHKIGLISECSERDIVTYYEYDGLSRLTTIRDQNKNIVKHFEYQYRIPIHNNPVWELTTEKRCATNSSGINTGEIEYKQIDSNPNSATYNQVRWINYGPSEECPVTAYANISYENMYTTFNETYADVAINLWGEVTGTTPLNPVTSIAVNYEKQQVDQYGNPSGTYTGSNYNCGYQSNPVEYNVPIWQNGFYNYDPAGLRYNFKVNAGAGYQLANQ
ncbi:hypothetical protein [Chitinophaga rhizosphaerae]|uniref:hypothetical protein n=1 Tax=Chitinophaga rhizosphaerae TaxID=1864947 RepID=UPI000F8115FF|nr:hypothetical protein [Chitinophaga rhizosphaerae]